MAGIVNVVVRNGKVVHYEATGGKGIEDSRPVEKNDLFRIYSMTKPITAVAAMQLYEQGKFRLSDPVHKFVPEFENLQVLNEQGILVDADRPMTMQQLLTHTTGLSYGFAAGVDMVQQLYTEADLWALENLDAILDNPNVEMIQWGPSDYSMNTGHPGDTNHPEVLEAKKKTFLTSIQKGVPPRAEINSSDQVKEYLDMGVRHFSVGTDISILFNFWRREGELILRALKGE